MELQQLSIEGKPSGKLEVSDAVIDRPFNEGLVHQVVVAFQTRARQGSKAQKNRSAVRGGGKKPWRQKGTGHARAGTNCSPIWRKGGVTFAAQPKDYSKSVKTNRKMYRGAMKCILSELNRQERLKVFETFDVSEPKTKELKTKMDALNLEGYVLIVSTDVSDALYLSSRNLKNVFVIDAFDIDPVSMVAFDHVIMTTAAIKELEEQLA